MARINGVAGEVTIAAAAVAGIKSWKLDEVSDALDSTGFDSAGDRYYKAGLNGWSGSFEGFKDGAPLAKGAEVAIELKQSATATQKYTGTVIITGVHPSVAVDGLNLCSYDFMGTGALVVATA